MWQWVAAPIHAGIGPHGQAGGPGPGLDHGSNKKRVCMSRPLLRDMRPGIIAKFFRTGPWARGPMGRGPVGPWARGTVGLWASGAWNCGPMGHAPKLGPGRKQDPEPKPGPEPKGQAGLQGPSRSLGPSRAQSPSRTLGPSRAQGLSRALVPSRALGPGPTLLFSIVFSFLYRFQTLS